MVILYSWKLMSEYKWNILLQVTILYANPVLQASYTKWRETTTINNMGSMYLPHCIHLCNLGWISLKVSIHYWGTYNNLASLWCPWTRILVTLAHIVIPGGSPWISQTDSGVALVPRHHVERENGFINI